MVLSIKMLVISIKFFFSLLYDIPYMQKSKEKQYKWAYLQNRNTHREWTYGYLGGRTGRRDREFGIDMYTLLTAVFKMDNQQDPIV